MPTQLLTATQATLKLQQGKITPQELKQELSKIISRKDPTLSAFLFQNDVQAEKKSAPLYGLPISFKDQYHIKNTPCSFGLATTILSDTTATIAEQLFNQGATLLGKTSLPPYAMDFQTSNKRKGFCNNPWNEEYTTGGSSGGGAAAVASGMSFIDMGTDLAGSLRIPASFCGVYSLLPSEQSVSNKGMLVNPNLTLTHFARPGPIARVPQDLDLIWKAIKEQDDNKNSVHCVNHPLKIAYWKHLDELPLDNDISKLITETVERWENAGHDCKQTKPSSLNFSSCWQWYGQIMGFETSGLINPFLRWLSILSGRSSSKRSPVFLTNVMKGYRRNKAHYHHALEERKMLIQQCKFFFQKHDVWILPVTCCRAFTHIKPNSERGPNRDYKTPLMVNNKEINYLDALTAYTTPISLIGHPVVTMPIGLDSNGLPVGIQLVGKLNEEDRLIQIASELSAQIQLPKCPAVKDIDDVDLMVTAIN